MVCFRDITENSLHKGDNKDNNNNNGNNDNNNNNNNNNVKVPNYLRGKEHNMCH